jgi:hypothetical protein
MLPAQVTFRHAELLDGGLERKRGYTKDNKPVAGGIL